MVAACSTQMTVLFAKTDAFFYYMKNAFLSKMLSPVSIHFLSALFLHQIHRVTLCVFPCVTVLSVLCCGFFISSFFFIYLCVIASAIMFLPEQLCHMFCYVL